MSPNRKAKDRIELNKHRIFFDGPVTKRRWPSPHLKTFENIQKLGRIQYDKYQEIVRADAEMHPWREQTKRRAMRIAKRASLCRKVRKNELGWRLTIESEVFMRFSVEVACRICRARLWRSEIEAAIDSSNPLADILREKQRSRRPCLCKQPRWKDDPQDQGINPIFDDRADEEILYDQGIKRKPDRVYGLRNTNRLDRLLWHTYDRRPSAGGKLLGESIRSTPFYNEREALRFPFLVIEAKSEKGRDSFTEIEEQTAFSIRRLLEIQQNLQYVVNDAAQDEAASEMHPLVWFISYKGEQWRVAAAFIVRANGLDNYRVADLWNGRIDSDEGALQLLLMIDYIFDWARDVYRETIISELMSLSISDSRIFEYDSDILSSYDRLETWIAGVEMSVKTEANASIKMERNHSGSVPGSQEDRHEDHHERHLVDVARRVMTRNPEFLRKVIEFKSDWDTLKKQELQKMREELVEPTEF